MISGEIADLINNSISVIGNSIVIPVAVSFLSNYYKGRRTNTDNFNIAKAEVFKKEMMELVDSGYLKYVELYKIKNYLSIAKKADDYTKEKGIPKSSIQDNFDWHVRLYELSSYSSDEEVQEIWAMILAEEISCGWSFSLLTLETLKNLDRLDAELFEKVCSHSFKNELGFFIPSSDKYLEKSKIKFGDILRLSELGLIHSGSDICYEMNDDDVIICSNEKQSLRLEKNNIDEKLIYGQHPYTLAGNEIARVLNLFGSDEEITQFAEIINENGRFSISVCEKI